MPSRPIEDHWQELASEDSAALWGAVSELLTNPEFCKEPESKPAAEDLLRDFLNVPAEEIERIINDPSCLAEHGVALATAQS